MKEHFTLTRFPNFALAIIIACAFAGCTTYSKVSERRPRFHPIARAVGGLGNAETALRQFERNPRDENARNEYNFAVARIIATIRNEKLDPWTQPLRVPASGGEFVLTHKPDPRPQWDPELYIFTPADQFDAHGTYVTERTTRGGIGAPIVAVGRELNKEARANFTAFLNYYAAT